VCDPSDPLDTTSQNPTDHAFDAANGSVVWQANDAASFSATTVAGGMYFNGAALSQVLDVRDAATGSLLEQVPLPQFNWSGTATVGDALVFGLGTTADAANSGIEVLTPGGAPPVIPGTG
jgi:outer membrane protein assembly factor BamB